MDLKGCLKTAIRNTLNGDLEDTIQKLSYKIKETRKAIQHLDKLIMHKAKYKIVLDSLWEGEGTSITEYRGRLEDAIKQAENEFKETNQRGDIQARYEVSIILAGNTYEIPAECWVSFTEKNRSPEK